jgi:diguanylate cyclase (GGDEF)-like protein
MTLQDEDQISSLSRVVWLILDAVAIHAVEFDPREHECFKETIHAISSRMEHNSNGPQLLILAGEAIQAIETYSRGVGRYLHQHSKELQSIVSLFTRTLLQVARSNHNSADKLREIERQIERTSHIDDIRLLRAKLADSLHELCAEADAQQRGAAEIGQQVRETIQRPETYTALSGLLSDIDIVTGLPSYRTFEPALRHAVAAHRNIFAVVLTIDRLETINSRFGFAVGDRVLVWLSQLVAQHFSKSDQFFRWRGPGIAALLERPGRGDAVRAEIARFAAHRFEQSFDLGARTALLPLSVSWVAVPLHGSTPDEVLRKLEQFSTQRHGRPAISES